VITGNFFSGIRELKNENREFFRENREPLGGIPFLAQMPAKPLCEPASEPLHAFARTSSSLVLRTDRRVGAAGLTRPRLGGQIMQAAALIFLGGRIK
jgi:hypothetical protein